MISPLPVPQVIERLQSLQGRPEAPLSDPWLLVLWENVAYLTNDERRLQAFELLRSEIGTDADAILAASTEALERIGRHGIVPKQSVTKLRRCAEIAVRDFEGDLRPILGLPLPEAKKALRKFPGIGEPGAEKILLFCRSHPVLGLESNGLRVLRRLGYGQDHKNYATMYHSVQTAIAPQLRADFGWRIRAHQLLRRHGQAICKEKNPRCAECPLAGECRDYQGRLGATGQ